MVGKVQQNHRQIHISGSAQQVRTLYKMQASWCQLSSGVLKKKKTPLVLVYLWVWGDEMIRNPYSSNFFQG